MINSDDIDDSIHNEYDNDFELFIIMLFNIFT